MRRRVLLAVVDEESVDPGDCRTGERRTVAEVADDVVDWSMPPVAVDGD